MRQSTLISIVMICSHSCILVILKMLYSHSLQNFLLSLVFTYNINLASFQSISIMCSCGSWVTVISLDSEPNNKILVIIYWFLKYVFVFVPFYGSSWHIHRKWCQFFSFFFKLGNQIDLCIQFQCLWEEFWDSFRSSVENWCPRKHVRCHKECERVTWSSVLRAVQHQCSWFTAVYCLRPMGASGHGNL